jgi:hypothetical protein
LQQDNSIRRLYRAYPIHEDDDENPILWWIRELQRDMPFPKKEKEIRPGRVAGSIVGKQSDINALLLVSPCRGELPTCSFKIRNGLISGIRCFPHLGRIVGATACGCLTFERNHMKRGDTFLTTVVTENAHSLLLILDRHRSQSDLKVHHLNDIALHVGIENGTFTERTCVLTRFRKGREARGVHAMATGQELNGGP